MSTALDVVREYPLYFTLSTLVYFASLFVLVEMLRKSKFAIDGRTVVITGASQGMGRGVAKKLSEEGANVVIVARNKKKLEDALTYIQSAAVNPKTQRFHYISADVTIAEENTRIIRDVTAWNNGQPPDIVWANAGVAIPGLLLDTSVDTLKSQMDINYFSAVYLAQATLKAWLEPSKETFSNIRGSNQSKSKAASETRHFVMTSSSSAFIGLAGYSPYAPCKSALRSFHDSLHSELEMYNGAIKKAHTSPSANGPDYSQHPEMRVHTIFPSTILSPGYDKENEVKPAVTKMLEEGDKGQTEDEVAAAAINGLDRGWSLITTEFLGSAMRVASLQASPRDRWFIDTLFSWIVTFVMLFVAPDMTKKARKWGMEKGMPVHNL